MEQVFHMRCKAFRIDGVRWNRLKVGEFGEVRVWDSVARHYTSCHSLGRGALLRIRRHAAWLNEIAKNKEGN